MSDSLEQFLKSTQSDASYRVDSVLKETDFEVTERVYFVGATGAEQGPYIRKRINAPEGSSLGFAYRRIFEAQQKGRRFHRIPRIVNCFSAGDQTTVVMEHIVGETLLNARRQGHLDAHKAFIQICDAVRELHEQFDPPIIHRDLKPSNVMVSGNDVTLIDFGIARTFNEGTETDTAQFGTRSYAPPEQFGFSQTDERSDVYALGLLLFFLETGLEPTATNRTGHFFHPDLNEQLRGIVNRAAALDPSQRFATVRDLQAAAQMAFESMRPKEEPASDTADAGSQTPSWRNPLPDQRSASQRIFGFVRNAAVLLVTAFCLAVTAVCTVDPGVSNQTAIFPAWIRALLYGSFLLIPEASIGYLIADKTPLRRRIPFFLQIKGETEIVAAIIVALGSFTLFLLVSALVSPMMPPVSR